MDTRFRGALFDMDGLLLDTESIVNQCLREAAKRFGIFDMDDTFLSLIGFRGKDSDAILLDGLAGRVELSVFCAESDKRIRHRIQQGLPVKAGVVSLLEALREQQLPCVVASSTCSEFVDKHLTEAGIRHYFQTITGGDQVVMGKPHPEIYHKAAESINVSAADCAAFEDSEPGTLAALASGATVVQIPDLIAPSDELIRHGHLIAADIWDGALQIGLVREK